MKHVTHRMSSFLALLVCLIPTLCNAQQPQLLTLDKPIDLRLHKATLMLVINTLSVDKNIPIGIEFSTNEKNEPKLNIDANKTPLVELLNMIVQQEPTYVWELRDGVINFSPVKDRDPFFQKLLNTQIRRFVSPKGNDKFAIRDGKSQMASSTLYRQMRAICDSSSCWPQKSLAFLHQRDLTVSN